MGSGVEGMETAFAQGAGKALMKLSVVIVSYNVSSYLDQTLRTLADSARGIDHEVYVVDNASADDSVDMVKRKHPDVHVIANTDNVGFARANNQALKHAKSEYVLLLNPDTVLRRDTVSAMLDFLDSHPEAGCAGCKVINPDGSLQLACRRGFPSPGVAFFKMVGLSNLFPRSRTFGAYNMTYLDPDELAEVDAVSGSFMMIRRTVLDEIGFLDEDFFMYGEDLDLCYRIKKAGYGIYYVPDTEIIHFKGESTKTVPSMKSIHTFYSAMQIFVEKHYVHRSWLFVPRSVLIAGIYGRMALVYLMNMLRRGRAQIIDLALINLTLVVSMMLRFGVTLDMAPDYTSLQWLSIFVVYSCIYMGTFYFLGMYHRYRSSTERAIIAVFLAFMFHIFVVNFIKQYNFSRIASFYSYGLNSILISGLRFMREELKVGMQKVDRRRTLIVSTIDNAVEFVRILQSKGLRTYEVVGCLEVSPDAIRGIEKDGVYILGLVEDLIEVIHRYDVEVVVMIGSNLPYSRILEAGMKIGSLKRPEFKLVPEMPDAYNMCKDTFEVTMIDILPGGQLHDRRS